MIRLLYIFGVAILFTINMAEETNVDKILYNGANEFTTKMLNKIVESRPDDSIAMSALSVMSPIAQLALASVGESHDELLENIGMPNDTVTKAAFLIANTQLHATKGITLKTASRVYVANNFEVNSEFASATKETFGSDIQPINFVDNQKAADEINSWIKEQTNNNIKDVFAPETMMSISKALLVNAVYFKGKWAERFNSDGTFPRNFYISKEKVIRTYMMFHNGEYKYLDSHEHKFQVLEIPLEGNEASFVIVVPRDIDGIKDLEEKLKDPTFLDEQMSKLQVKNVGFYLPRFKIETKIDLKNIFQKMGISKMFDPETARLEHLLQDTDNNNIFINSAIQTAFIEVYEDGAEIPRPPDTGYSYIEVERPPAETLKADRPFYYAIKTKSLTLFNGVFHGEQQEPLLY